LLRQYIINLIKEEEMKKRLFLFLGIGAFLILSSTFGVADELSFNGIHFTPAFSHYDVAKSLSGYVYQDGASGGWMSAPVVFPNSASGMNVTRLSVTYWDNDPLYYLRVRLYKTDRWSGSSTMVADLESGAGEASASISYMNMPKSQMTAYGIDNNRYAWYLYFWRSDSDGSAGTDMRLNHVTIRYE